MKERQPTQRGKKKTPIRTKILGSAILVSAVGVAAFGAYELTQNNNQKPEPTPIAGGIGEPTPSITPEATIFVSPSPEITQSPTPEPSPTPDTRPWYQQIPESPYKNIDEVPLSKDSFGFPRIGQLEMMALPDLKPGYYVHARGFTILSAKADVKNNRIIMIVTAGGKTIKNDGSSLFNVSGVGDINMYTMEGGNFKVIFKQGAGVVDGSKFLGTDLSDAARYLKAGTSINFSLPMGHSPGGDSAGLKTGDLKTNLNSWNTYRSQAGMAVPPRTSPDLLTFIPYIIDISTS